MQKRPNAHLLLAFLTLAGIVHCGTTTRLRAIGFNDDKSFNRHFSDRSSYDGKESLPRPQKRSDDIDEGWSAWGDWTACSRTCDGGASHQLRRCNARQGCRGESIRYRICSTQPCPEAQDFRAQQCAAYNSIDYHGKVYEWDPHYDSQDPCSLTCRAKNQNLVAQLYPKVLDGTPCREGSLDMCIDGKCQPVGCDLELGSTKKVDACGECGGDGSCLHPSFFWEESALSACPVTCGGGVKVSSVVCKNRKTGEEVSGDLCDVSKRPVAKSQECNMEKCPAAWVIGDWGPCSTSCGGGWQERKVYCADPPKNETRMRTDDSHCPDKKPKERKLCNPEDCPRWYETTWSGCSVTCGHGYQVRTVVCRDARGHVTDSCDHKSKPVAKQQCTTGLACRKTKPESTTTAVPEHYFPIVQPYPPPLAQRQTGKHTVSSEAGFMADPWSSCSVTCGEGTRQRDAPCKIFLEFSQTFATLPDKECPGPKPAETERCVLRPCAMNRLNDEAEMSIVSRDEQSHRNDGRFGVVVTYSWRQIGFTPCSASCLAGVRESIVQCVRDHDHAAVSPLLCDIAKKPDIVTQTCNDNPCPPRWNISEYVPCSKSCGGGFQTRHVHCIHEVTRGNTLNVPAHLCQQPAPKAHDSCNVLDCAPQWELGTWTKCSKSCGGGVKTRKLECKQLLATGQQVVRSISKCPQRRPVTLKACNTKTCVDDNFPEIHRSNQSYVQATPLRRVSLKIGGKAVVFKGTRLKIKCPVRRFDRSRIQWAKDHRFLHSSRRFRISRKGTLRIKAVQFTDAGVYVCMAGGSQANISITVKLRPSPFTNSDEDRTVERPANSVEEPPPPAAAAPPRQFTLHDFRGMKPKTPATKSNKFHTIEDNDEEISHEKSRPDVDLWPSIPRPKVHQQGFSPVPVPPTWSRALKPKTVPADKEEDTKHNSLESDLKSFDTWEYQHGENGGTLFSDQTSGELDTKTLHDTGSPDHSQQPEFSEEGLDTNPGGNSRTHPRIHTLLVNLKQNLGASRGHRMVSSHPLGLISDDANSFVLGKGKAENLQFDWMISNWSTCSQSCGGHGTHTRTSHCLVQLHNVTKTVGNSLCIDAGLKIPTTIEKCGIPECPRWEPGNWSRCEDARCVAWNTALQRRDVRCQLSNGTRLDGKNCDETTKPREKRDCFNDKCRGIWKPEEWSECTASCGQTGVRSRELHCVWTGNQKAPRSACHSLPRPAVVKSCKGPPCPDMEKCTDDSKYCRITQTLHMCQMFHYRMVCCFSCKDVPY